YTRRSWLRLPALVVKRLDPLKAAEWGDDWRQILLIAGRCPYFEFGLLERRLLEEGFAGWVFDAAFPAAFFSGALPVVEASRLSMAFASRPASLVPKNPTS